MRFLFFIYSIVMNITCLFRTWPYSCIWLRNNYSHKWHFSHASFFWFACGGIFFHSFKGVVSNMYTAVRLSVDIIKTIKQNLHVSGLGHEKDVSILYYLYSQELNFPNTFSYCLLIFSCCLLIFWFAPEEYCAILSKVTVQVFARVWTVRRIVSVLLDNVVLNHSAVAAVWMMYDILFKTK